MILLFGFNLDSNEVLKNFFGVFSRLYLMIDLNQNALRINEETFSFFTLS